MYLVSDKWLELTKISIHATNLVSIISIMKSNNELISERKGGKASGYLVVGKWGKWMAWSSRQSEFESSVVSQVQKILNRRALKWKQPTITHFSDFYWLRRA